MPVNFVNDHFQSFVNFAQQRFDAGAKKAVISASVNNPLQERSILNCAESRTDSVHKWRRNAGEVTDNNQTRTLFRQAVAEMFGGEAKIPKSVKKAMLLDDYGKGKPLTARRILAVKAAIDPFAQKFAEKFEIVKQSATKAYSKVNEDRDLVPGEERVTTAQVDGLVKMVLKAAGTDGDAFEILASSNVMNGILIGGGASPRPADAVEQKVQRILANLAELREAAGGDPAILAAGKSFLALLIGKSVPDGMIAAIVRQARAANVTALKSLSRSSTGLAIHKALNEYVECQTRIADNTGAVNALEGADEKDAIRDFIGRLLIAKCGKSSVRKIQAALHSENAQKLKTIYDMVSEEDFDKRGLSSAVTSHTGMMGGRARRYLGKLQIAADAAAGVPENEIEELPSFKEPFNYNAFKAGSIVNDLVKVGKAEARRTLDVFLQTVVRGDSKGADLFRKVYRNRLGDEAYEPKETIGSNARGNVSAMLNWTIAAECKKCAQGQFADSTFAKDIKRMQGSLKVGDVVLSADFNTARNQIAAFVSKGARTTYGELSDAEKGKAHIVMALLSQETAKAAFDGQFTALDKKNTMPPASLPTDQEADRHEIAVTLCDDGRLTVEFHGTQFPQFILADPGDGKPVNEALSGGSKVEARMNFTLKAHEFDRLAQLDYTKFDDTRANEINTNNDVRNKIPKAVESFPAGFPFGANGYTLSVGLKSTLN